MQKRKSLPMEEKIASMKAQFVDNAQKQQTTKQAENRKVQSERLANLRKREPPKERPIKKATIAQRKKNLRALESHIKNRLIGGKEMRLVLKRVETDVVKTLLQHGITLSHDDLQTLCNHRKSSEKEMPSAMETDLIPPKDPSIPIVSLITREAEIPQEPLPRVEQQKVDATHLITFNPTVVVQSTSVKTAVTSQVILSPNKNGCKKQFMEHLNLTKQVPTTTYGKMAVKRNKQVKIAPSVKNGNVRKRKAEPLRKTLLPVSKEIIIPTTGNNHPTSHMVALRNLPNSQPNSRNARVLSKVKIVKLSVENLQKLQNNKQHIQYLSTKKDLSPQESLLLPNLIENQQNILSLGKIIPTFPGQAIKGIPFLCGECMYLVQIPQALPDIRQSSKQLVTIAPNAEPSPSFAIENCSNSSLNLPQTNHSDMKNSHEVTLNNGNDYILPDSERKNCHSQSCVIEVALLRTQLDQKSIALDSCNLELNNLKDELEKAKEYIASLRAQLEENTETLCSYLAASSS